MEGIKYIFLAMFGFIGAAFFHGALIFGGVIFFIHCLMSFKKFIKSIMNLRLNFQSFILVIFFYFSNFLFKQNIYS